MAAAFPIVWTTYFQTTLLNNAIGSSSVAGLLNKSRCGLGQTAITPGASVAWADTGEGGYAGYAEPATIVWTALLNEVDQSVTSQSPAQLFRATGASSVTMNNFFVNDGVGISSITNVGSSSTGVYGSGRIVPGYQYSVAGDGFSLVINWNSGLATLNCEGTQSF